MPEFRRAPRIPLLARPADLSAAVARLLVVITGLNLNGFTYMMTGLEQAFSPVLLAGSCYLVLGFGRWAVRDSTVIAFAAAIFLYLAFGTFFSGIDAPEAQFQHSLTYASSVLLLVGMAAFVSSRSNEREILSFVRFTKYTLVLSCVSVLFSHELHSLYTIPLSSMDRNAGLFGNANEAGITSAITLALVLSFPERRVFVNIAHALITLAAVGLSFSKSSMLVTVIILLVHALRMRSLAHILLPAAALTVIGAFLVHPVAFSSLSISQQARLDQLPALLSGEITDETTTGRTSLWSLALDRIESNFPWGSGLGQFHHMVGGTLHEDVWMGAHNSYLMVWGEAGLLAFVALVAASAIMLVRSWHWRFVALPLLYFIVLQFDLLSAHNVLGLRFHNLMMGLCFGILCWLSRSHTNLERHSLVPRRAAVPGAAP
ncbi:O-antigen ligase family protein [Sinorhizobium meliloti]|uniref:O-antigen ligase family protein n=1 Tax=Rhizobium meliloti TaxID=382 RepID=UPI0020913674|nr:O-antigen ligase family protein [Sinorhizobium meliloti]MCO5965390.1 O-antigen ligase family protein [Sinorhizobium meliloti]